MGRKKKLRYSPTLPSKMYLFFLSYGEEGAPSFQKFAKSIGATVEDVERFREHKSFERAYRECCEIRRDYLIDRALTKRFDPSFVKFLLTCDLDTDGENDELTLKLEVTP